MTAAFQRRILHHGPDPFAAGTVVSDRAVAGCWFELHRQGGCGAGEVVLRDGFLQRGALELGDWISLEAAPGDRWYLGRVEERRSTSPAEVRVRLEGMAIELAEVFPGGFGLDVDGAAPHRYAATDLFPHDPDRALETVDTLATADAIVHRLLQQYVVPATHVNYDPTLIETPLQSAPVQSLKFRGEESVQSVLKELALRSQANWGVDAWGRFFFQQRRDDLLATWREGRDLTSLQESRDREHLFNRILLTGDYIYDVRAATDHLARPAFRWRGNYVQPASRDAHGERRIRLWIPWLRTEADSLAFVREFFRVYAQPTSRYLLETTPQSELVHPWTGRVRLEDREGHLLLIAAIESIRVTFDHAPRFRLELGPEDPRNLWPEPPHDERWELPEGRAPGGGVDLTDPPHSDPPTHSGDLSDELSGPRSDSASDTGSLESGPRSGPVSSEFASGPADSGSMMVSDLSSGDGSLDWSDLLSDGSELTSGNESQSASHSAGSSANSSHSVSETDPLSEPGSLDASLSDRSDDISLGSEEASGGTASGPDSIGSSGAESAGVSSDWWSSTWGYPASSLANPPSLGGSDGSFLPSLGSDDPSFPSAQDSFGSMDDGYSDHSD